MYQDAVTRVDDGREWCWCGGRRQFRYHFPSQVANMEHLASACLRLPSPPTTHLTMNLSLLPFQGVTRRNVDEKETLSITKPVINSVQICQNR
jgi:hypothetical protein